MDLPKSLLSKQNIVLFFLLSILMLALIAWAVWFITANNSQPLNNTIYEEGKILVNEKGIRWGPLPTGKYEFQVTSANDTEGPVFLEGEINPPDVHVGDTQHLRVVVQSPAGIKSVTAYIETDNEEEVLPLAKTGVVAFKDMKPQKYIVDAENKLVILSNIEMYARHLEKIVSEQNSLINKAKAQQGEKESWENSWVVRDTHNTIYHTTFVAEDNAGQTNSLTIAWSDACAIPLAGDWNIDTNYGFPCTIDGVDGVDNGNAIIQKYDLTVNGTFAFNDGKIIDLDNIPRGRIIRGLGGQIRNTNLWVCDWDADGYAVPGALANQKASDDDPGSGPGPNGCGHGTTTYNNFFERFLALFSPPKSQAAEICGNTNSYLGGTRRHLMNLANPEGDCWDEAYDMHDGSTVFCSTSAPGAPNQWDYNCDGGVDLQLPLTLASCDPPAISSCSTSPPNQGCFINCDSLVNPGWVNKPPSSCGGWGLEASGCIEEGFQGMCRENPSGPPDFYCPNNYWRCEGSVPTGSTLIQQGCR